MVDISISLISTNERHHLERLLPSLLPAARLANAEILVVDHRCEDGTRNYLEGHYPEVSVISNPVQTSYGDNHNINLRRAQGRYFVIMNTDIVINSLELFANFSDYLDRFSDVGLISPKILNPDGTVQGLNRLYPSVFDFFLRRFAPRSIQKIFGQRMNHYEMRDIGYDHDYDAPILSGCFMFCRSDLLNSLGGFNPRYPNHFDDVDLCRRIQKTHRTVYLHQYSITHFWKRVPYKSWLHAYRFCRMAFRYFNQWGWRFF